MTIGGISCLNPALRTEHSSINCTAPEGIGKGKEIVVSVGGQSGSGDVFNYDSITNSLLLFLTYTVPTVLNTTSASTKGGFVTVTGYNFGPRVLISF